MKRRLAIGAAIVLTASVFGSTGFVAGRQTRDDDWVPDCRELHEQIVKVNTNAVGEYLYQLMKYKGCVTP